MTTSALLSSEGQAAWKALEPKLRARGVFWDGLAGGQFELFVLVAAFEGYLLCKKAAAQLAGRSRAKWLREAETWRITVRQHAAKFFDLLPPERVHLAPIGPDGEDAEISAWFTPENTQEERRRDENATCEGWRHD